MRVSMHIPGQCQAECDCYFVQPCQGEGKPEADDAAAATTTEASGTVAAAAAGADAASQSNHKLTTHSQNNTCSCIMP